MTRVPPTTRVERWEHRAEVPLMILALAFVVAYAWPVLNPRLDSGLRTMFSTLSWALWTGFALDLVVRLVLAKDRLAYVISHWYDVFLVVLPVLRPLRLLRLLLLLRILHRSARSTLAERVLVYAASVALLAVSLGALAVLDVEQEADGANITTFGDAVWWACTTMTTVGYGDHFPITTPGRFVAVLLMAVGVALVGSVTAAMASWMLARTEFERAAARDENPGRSLDREQ